MSTDTCLFCKEFESPDNTFAVKTDDCLCKTNVHEGCLFKLNVFFNLKVNTSIKGLIEKYMNNKYSLCRTCKHKYQPSVNSETKISDKIYCINDVSHAYNNQMKYRFKTTNPANKDKMYHIEVYHFDYSKSHEPAIINDYYEDSNHREHGQLIKRTDSHPYNITDKGMYNHGRRHGEYNEYYLGSGRIHEKRTYVNGSKNGMYIKYYDNEESSKYLEVLYEDDSKHGYERKYSQSGILMEETFYLDDAISYAQPYRKYNHYNGTLVLEISLIETLQYQRSPTKSTRTYDLVHYKEFNADGSVKSDSKQYSLRGYSRDEFIDHDIPNVKYHSNGKIQVRKTFMDDNESLGYNRLILVETFYSTGQKNERYTIKHDPCATMEGPYICWHQDGKYKKICEYRNNDLINQCGIWNSEGLLVSFGKYSEDGNYKPIQLNI